MTLRNKRISKQSFFSKLKSYPFDFLLSINEQRELIDWDTYAITFALPLGYFLTFLFFLCTLIQGTKQQQSSEFFDYEEEEKAISLIENFLNGVLLILWFVCIINTYRFFTSSRSYYIYNKDFNDQNSSLRKIEKSRSLFGNIQEYFQMIRSSENIDTYWELKIWNPSKFSTYLFISFSPLNLIYLRTFSSSISISLLNSFLLHYLIIFKFIQQAQDKKTLFEETMDEYQKKFVNSRLSIKQKSVGIDATKGPFNDEYINIENPGKYSKIFKTHDFKGREVTEYFDEKLNEFQVFHDKNIFNKKRF